MVRGVEYWLTGWREEGKPRGVHLGPVSSMTEEEALALARQKKEAVFGELEPVAAPRTHDVGQPAGGDLTAEIKQFAA